MPGGDMAIWNTLLIGELEKRDDIELHVIAPMYHMKPMTQKFAIGKTHYYFYKPDVPFLNVAWMYLGNLDARSNYWWARHCVQKWIREIDPDIVNLIGAENPHYSASILGLKGYPVFVSMQSVYSNPDRFKVLKEDKLRSRFERWVISENKYFGVNAPFMPDLIKRDAKSAICMWNRFPTPGGDRGSGGVGECGSGGVAKEYDFVQFSGITELKGAPDTIKATAIVKKEFPNVKVRMMGGIKPDFMAEMQMLIKELDLGANIVLTNGFKAHADLMQEAAKARNYVLPTKVDTIPTTIFEATHLGLPVVSYKTGDIPKLNTGDERVLLADRLDVEGLAQQMLRLLREPSLGVELNRKTREFTDRYFSNEANVEQHIAICRAVIDNYCNGTTIPEELMYDGYLERKIAVSR
ncbi:MAG: glycosyltransferase family 4 protein [Kiritimatiellae bacterium]|nr:glycosyltransferase family 4 protein [Kiritimatiellia bacterium]